jgi:excisionase family DNA binding protein
MNEQPSSPGQANWKTKREIAAHLKCSVRTVTTLMARRMLPYVKIGHFVRFDLAECDRAMARYRVRGVLE